MNRKRSMASRIVTSEPNRFQTLPSSSPMTPPPMTPRRCGGRSNSSAPSESTMYSPSNGAIGSSTGSEPAARMTCSACSRCGSPSCGVTSTCRPASSLPRPFTAVTPLARNNALMPVVSWRTMRFLRSCIAFRSSVTSGIMMPWPANSSRVRWYSSDDSRSTLDGMQPAFRQVPPSAGLPLPSRQSSTQATDMPSCAARIAPT